MYQEIIKFKGITNYQIILLSMPKNINNNNNNNINNRNHNSIPQPLHKLKC